MSHKLFKIKCHDYNSVSMPLSNEDKENLLRILLNSLVVPFILSVVVRNGQSFGRRRDEPLDHHGNTATVRLPQTNRPPARTSHPPTIYRPATTRTSCHCAVCRLFGTCVLAASSAVAALVTCVLVASRAVAARRAHGCSPKCRDRARGSAHHQPASRHKLPHRHRLSRCLFFHSRSSQPVCCHQMSHYRLSCRQSSCRHPSCRWPSIRWSTYHWL